MYVRLAFAVAAHLEPEILIVDEVLAVGDELFQKKCLGKMEEIAVEGRTILFVSHNLSAVLNLMPASDSAGARQSYQGRHVIRGGGPLPPHRRRKTGASGVAVYFNRARR